MMPHVCWSPQYHCPVILCFDREMLAIVLEGRSMFGNAIIGLLNTNRTVTIA